MAGLLALLSHIITSLSALHNHGLTNLLSRFVSFSVPRPPQMHLAFMEREGSTGVFGLALVKCFFEARLRHADDS